MLKQAQEGVPTEIGGLLLGKAKMIGQELTTWVLKAIVGDCTSSSTRVVIEPSTYSESFWTEFEAGRSLIVGWYHSHPGFGVFLSQTDRQTMFNHYRAPHQIAIVIDPILNAKDAFGWTNVYLDTLEVKASRLLRGDHRLFWEG